MSRQELVGDVRPLINISMLGLTQGEMDQPMRTGGCHDHHKSLEVKVELEIFSSGYIYFLAQ